LRRLLLHAALGVVLTYAVTAFVVLVLPVPGMGSGYSHARLHRADYPTSRPYLRLRIRNKWYSGYFQIHRTSQRGAALFYDLDPNDPEQLARTPENPKLADPAFIPSWSVLRHDWPNSLSSLEGLFGGGGVYHEIRMGWPFPCLRGSFAQQTAYEDSDTVSTHGVVTIMRRAWYWGPFHKIPMKVGMPLIPDWPPFLASVAFYGVLTFVIPAGWRALVHRRRRRRGRCIQCGYDLRGGSNRCPECGHLVVAAAAML
jgi:hypothetical protein